MINYDIFDKHSIMTYYYCQQTSQENINNQYRGFYKWINEQCNKDTQNVYNKKLKYLYKTYTDLQQQIEEQLNADKYINQLRTIEKNELYVKKIRNYIETTQDEYNDITDIVDKNYRFYDNLSSWYTLKTMMTAKVLQKVYKKILDEENQKEEQKRTKQNEYLVSISYSENEQINVVVKLFCNICV